MPNYFKVSTDENVGDNWLIALGGDWDGKSYYITTDHIHAPELYLFSQGAKADAELIVRLLNEHYAKLMESTNGA